MKVHVLHDSLGSMNSLVPHVAHRPPAGLLKGQPGIVLLVQPDQAQRQDGTHASGRQPPFLVHFLSRTPFNVPVGQPRSSQLGDIRHKEAKYVGKSPTERQGLLPDSGLALPEHVNLQAVHQMRPMKVLESLHKTWGLLETQNPAEADLQPKQKKYISRGHQPFEPVEESPLVEVIAGVSGTKVFKRHRAQHLGNKSKTWQLQSTEAAPCQCSPKRD